MIKAIGVVVPAHNEEDLLPACLTAVRQAARVLAGMPVHLVAVADACTDRTADCARRAGAIVLEIHARSVGTAREAGVREVLSRTRQLAPADVWLATTDADTLVPPGWLSQHLDYADAGWDAVVGTVTVTDWAEHPPRCRLSSTSATATARAPIRTCTAPISASAPGPTAPPVASARALLLRTMRWSSHSGLRAPPSCTPRRSTW
jgi:glycosyltransferase involved in cell wall biosynthesis